MRETAIALAAYRVFERIPFDLGPSWSWSLSNQNFPRKYTYQRVCWLHLMFSESAALVLGMVQMSLISTLSEEPSLGFICNDREEEATFPHHRVGGFPMALVTGFLMCKLSMRNMSISSFSKGIDS